MKEQEKAESMFSRAYALNPDYKKGLIDYADFLLKIGKFGESLKLAENIKTDEALKFQYYLIKGKADMGMEKYSEALQNLLEANKIYNSDISLLNSLGFCYYRSGEMKKALDVL